MSVQDYTEFSIEKLLPHSPPMILIDDVENMTEQTIRCSANYNDVEYFKNREGVPSYWALEIISQACAIYISIHSLNRSLSMGRLLKCRHLVFNQAFIPYEVPVTIDAELTLSGSNGVWMFNGSLFVDAPHPIAKGDFSIFAQ